MKIAIPTVQGALCLHFGHCEKFAIFEVDMEKKEIIDSQMLAPPAHEPGVLPRWLAGAGANVIITGGMGMMAQKLFIENGVEVISGAPADDAQKVAQAYINGDLTTGANACDH
ncbi:MAG: ATPase [Deltaproteobacteria bacterium]|nr:ATPase [Deltaproteobacteria bacterium]